METAEEIDLRPGALCRSTGVLVVDDNPDARDLLCAQLRWAGYEAIAAADGVEALQMLENSSLPELILLDLLMPNMDGLDVVAALRASPALASIPVILISASSHPDLNGWRSLQKPIPHEALLHVVREFCGDEPAGGLGA